MALKLNYDDPRTGAEYPDMYFRVVIGGYDPKNSIFIQCFGFPNKGASDSKMRPISAKEYQLSASSPEFEVFFSISSIGRNNLIKAAYNYLKTLEDFKQATDVLEQENI